MIALALGGLAAAASGILLMLVLVRRPGNRDLNGWVLLAAAGAGIGFGLQSILSFLGLLLASRPSSLAAELFLVAVLAGILFLRQRRGSGTAPPTQLPADTGARIPGVFSAWVVAIGLSVASFVLFTLFRPHGDWDAWAIWNLRARFLFEGGGVWTDAFNPAMRWSHPDYPLLLPLAVARLWSYAGVGTIAAPALIAWLYTFASVAVLGTALSVLVGRLQGMIGTLVLLGTPYFLKLGAAQQADIPVAFFCLSAAVALQLAARGGDGRMGWMTVAGLAAALAGWTKNEGLVMLLGFGVAAAMIGPGGRRERSRAVIAYAAGALPALLAVGVFKILLAPPSYLLAGATKPLAGFLDPARYALIAAAYGRELVSMGMAIPLAVAAVLIGRPAAPGAARRTGGLFLALGIIVASHIAAYLVTPLDLAWQLGTSLNRLLVQLWPTCVFAVFLAIREPGEFGA